MRRRTDTPGSVRRRKRNATPMWQGPHDGLNLPVDQGEPLPFDWEGVPGWKAGGAGSSSPSSGQSPSRPGSSP